MPIAARPRALVWLLVLPLALSAQEPQPRKFSIAVRHVTLAELAPILSRLSGAEVLIEPAVRDREVSLTVLDQPLDAVLSELAKVNNLTWRRDGARYMLASGVEPVQAGVVTRREVTTQTMFVLVPKATAQAQGVDLAAAARGLSGHHSALLQALRRSPDACLVTAPKIISISGESSQLQFRSTGTAPAGEYQQQFEIRVTPTAPGADGHTVLDFAAQWWVGTGPATWVFEAHAGPVSMRVPTTESLLVAMQPGAAKDQPETAHRDLRQAIFGPQAASLSDLVILAVVAPVLIREEGVDYTVGVAK